MEKQFKFSFHLCLLFFIFVGSSCQNNKARLAEFNTCITKCKDVDIRNDFDVEKCKQVALDQFLEATGKCPKQMDQFDPCFSPHLSDYNNKVENCNEQKFTKLTVCYGECGLIFQ